VVWQPDAENVYLSSGCDNIAIHRVPANFANDAQEKQLDHLGFVVESIERVKELEQEFTAKGVRMVHPFKISSRWQRVILLWRSRRHRDSNALRTTVEHTDDQINFKFHS